MKMGLFTMLNNIIIKPEKKNPIVMEINRISNLIKKLNRILELNNIPIKISSSPIKLRIILDLICPELCFIKLNKKNV